MSKGYQSLPYQLTQSTNASEFKMLPVGDAGCLLIVLRWDLAVAALMH